MTKGAALYRLQSLDSEGDVHQSRLTNVKAALGESEELRQAHRAVESAQALARKWQSRQHNLELEIQGLADKTSRSEQRLYSGAVTNPKELTDLQAKVASLRRRRQKLEDDLLEAMIEREETEAAQAQAQQHLDEVRTSWSAQQADLMAEQEELEQRLEEIKQARAELLPSIDADDLETYQSLRRRKGGLAVTQITNDACGVCGLAVSPNLKWQLRHEGMVTCTNCERIIVQL
jgi:predicted  nucleic acid-binding Zn-ribbon protein